MAAVVLTTKKWEVVTSRASSVVALKRKHSHSGAARGVQKRARSNLVSCNLLFIIMTEFFYVIWNSQHFFNEFCLTHTSIGAARRPSIARYTPDATPREALSVASATPRAPSPRGQASTTPRSRLLSDAGAQAIAQASRPRSRESFSPILRLRRSSFKKPKVRSLLS